jgi:hypothetical protein
MAMTRWLEGDASQPDRPPLPGEQPARPL